MAVLVLAPLLSDKSPGPVPVVRWGFLTFLSKPHVQSSVSQDITISIFPFTANRGKRRHFSSSWNYLHSFLTFQINIDSPHSTLKVWFQIFPCPFLVSSTDGFSSLKNLFFILKIRAVYKDLHLSYLLQESGFMTVSFLPILLSLCFCWLSLKLFHFSSFKGDICFLFLKSLAQVKAVYTIHQH